MATKHRDAASLIRALLMGQASAPSPNAIAKILVGGGHNYNQNSLVQALGASNTAPKITGYAPGMRRGESVIGPNGQVLGLGPSNDTVAPPVMGSAKHPGMGLKGLNLAARAAIASQYDPVIGTLSNQIGITKNEAQHARHQIRRQGNRAVGDLSFLYGNLGRDVRRTKRYEDRNYRRDIRHTKESYRDLHKAVNADYSTSIGETAKELQRLGIDPSVALQGAARDQAAFNAQNTTSRKNRVLNQRESRRDYNHMMKEMRHDVIATGLSAIGQSKTQTRSALSDLANTLADNLFKLRSQRAAVQGQEAAAYANQRASLIAARGQARGNALDRKIKKAQLAKLLGLLPSGASGSGFTATDPVGKGLDFLAANTGKVQHADALANILQYVTGGAGPGQTVPFDKHNYGAIWDAMVKTGKRHGWTQADMNYLQRALQISLGV